jgi:rhodanese-related sulfurtransferase
MFDKLKKMFTPAEALEPDESRRYMKEHEEGTYTLLDVRQPSEYEEEHIPGATLIPMPKLSDSYERLDKDKPVLVY